VCNCVSIVKMTHRRVALDWRLCCVQLKCLEEDKVKLEVVVGGLERKLVEAVKGQGSRDTLIDSLQVKIRQLQQHSGELQVTATHTHTHTHTLQVTATHTHMHARTHTLQVTV